MMQSRKNLEMHSLTLRAGKRSVARGAVLLEVIISMGLLIFGMAVVGLQVNAGLDAARSADIGTRGVMLADTKLAELKAGILQPETNDDELKGDFGAMYPGYSWRISIQPTDLDVFNMITLEIGFNRKEMDAQIANPDRELDFEDEGTRTIHTAHRLVPIPADVNLERDFGLSQDELARLQDPGGNGDGGSPQNEGQMGGGGLDGLNDLLANLGSLSDLQSFDPRMLSALPDEEFAKIAALLEAFLGRGSSTNATPEEMLADLLKDSGGGGQGGGGGGGEPNNNTGGGGMSDGGNQNTGSGQGGRGDVSGGAGGRRSSDGSRSGSDARDGSDSDSGSGESRGESRRNSRRERNRGRGGNDSGSESDSGSAGNDRDDDSRGNNNSRDGRAGSRRGRDSDSGNDDPGGRSGNRTRRQREDDGSQETGNRARGRDDRDRNTRENNSTDEEEEENSRPRRRTNQPS